MVVHSRQEKKLKINLLLENNKSGKFPLHQKIRKNRSALDFLVL
jgi:hypothetical protein